MLALRWVKAGVSGFSADTLCDGLPPLMLYRTSAVNFQAVFCQAITSSPINQADCG